MELDRALEVGGRCAKRLSRFSQRLQPLVVVLGERQLGAVHGEVLGRLAVETIAGAARWGGGVGELVG